VTCTPLHRTDPQATAFQACFVAPEPAWRLREAIAQFETPELVRDTRLAQQPGIASRPRVVRCYGDRLDETVGPPHPAVAELLMRKDRAKFARALWLTNKIVHRALDRITDGTEQPFNVDAKPVALNRRAQLWSIA
jgi:hypothetical protein